LRIENSLTIRYRNEMKIFATKFILQLLFQTKIVFAESLYETNYSIEMIRNIFCNIVFYLYFLKTQDQNGIAVRIRILLT